QQAAPPIETADERCPAAQVVHHEPARRGLVDGAQPAPTLVGTARASPAGATAGGGHAAMVTMRPPRGPLHVTGTPPFLDDRLGAVPKMVRRAVFRRPPRARTCAGECRGGPRADPPG